MGWVLSWPVNGIAASNSGAGSRPRAAMVAASRGGVELNRSCQLLSSRLFPERASMAFFSAAPDRGWSAREKHLGKKGEGDLHTAEASLCDAILQLSPVVHRRRRPCWLPRRGFRHGVERRREASFGDVVCCGRSCLLLKTLPFAIDRATRRRRVPSRAWSAASGHQAGVGPPRVFCGPSYVYLELNRGTVVGGVGRFAASSHAACGLRYGRNRMSTLSSEARCDYAIAISVRLLLSAL